jgi:putative membrane protein
MHTGNHYKLREFILWTRHEIYGLTLLAALPTVLFQIFKFKWLALPWVPIALIGTAAAFIVGFKNTQTYNRLWEARQIWGAIVNGSRSWGMMVKDFISSEGLSAEELQAIQQALIYRHIAWLTALRFQLREPKSWENSDKKYNREYRKYYHVAEREEKLEEVLSPLLSEAERDYVWAKKNRATHVIALQSKQLKALVDRGLLPEFRYVAMSQRLADFYDQQGKCERIKNFPYPRQFASINLFFIRLFVWMVPFGLLNEFQKLGDGLVWLTIPFSVLVSWVFTSMEQVGESTENPFEGGANDVPITALSRTIEIDLREMLEETDLPPALQPVNNILM